MSKSNKKKSKIADKVKTEELDKQAEIAEGVIETKEDTKQVNTKKTKDDKKASKKNKKKDNNKKGLVKKTKETVSELKKVTWPTFPEVVKKTGIVIAFVIIFGIAIFAVDSLVGWLSQLLVG